MNTTVTIGKRLVPLKHVAMVAPFDPAANPWLQSDKQFRGRVILIDRESILTEQEPLLFAEKHGFRMLLDDGVATNPVVHFRVESFAPDSDFQPTKQYETRLLWRDLDGNTQSLLLLSKPENVLAIAVHGEPPEQIKQRGASPSGDGRRRSRRSSLEHVPT